MLHLDSQNPKRFDNFGHLSLRFCASFNQRQFGRLIEGSFFPSAKGNQAIHCGDDSLDIAVKRGKIVSTISKADMLDWMASGDPEDWGDESFTLNEVVASEGVAYAWTTIANTDE